MFFVCVFVLLAQLWYFIFLIMREKQRAWMWVGGGGGKDVQGFGGGEKCDHNTLYEKSFSIKIIYL